MNANYAHVGKKIPEKAALLQPTREANPQCPWF